MNKKKLIWYLIVIIPIALLIWGYLSPNSFFSNQDNLRKIVDSYGIFGPLVFILIQAFQVVFTPISHYAVGITGGLLFGVWLGFLYNWIGRVLGTIIAFYLGRKIGRKIIKYFVKPGTVSKYDKIFEKGKIVLFLMYFLPFFPDDELSYLAGFSSIKWKVFIPIIILGHIGGSLTLAYIGSGISINDPLFYIVSGIILISGVLFIIFYKKFNKNC